MNKIFSILTIFILLHGISALCEEGQVDINEAEAKDLEKIYGVGPATAENIISSRPFDSVGDLMEVSGIGQVKMDKIEEQNLACVNNEDERAEEKMNGESMAETVNEEVELEATTDMRDPSTLNAIKLDTKTIKSQDNNDFSLERYAIYGLIVLGLLASLLLFFRYKKYRTEFK